MAAKTTERLEPRTTSPSWFEKNKKTLVLLTMVAPVAIWLLLLRYLPMGGIVLAFKNYKVNPRNPSFISNLINSKWVGFKNFEFLFKTDSAWVMIRNTLAYNIVFIILGVIIPVAFAIMMNEVRNMFGKKLVQTVSYLPHFLSWIVVTGILHDALSSTGIINEMLVNLGILNSPINFFANPGYFWPIVAFANVWKETGWNAIVYLAAITSIDPSLYEAATLDGAGRWGKIWHVTLPGIKSTIMILLIMNIGNVLNAGFEVQYLLGNGLVKSVSETIDIYTLTWGISQNDYSLGTAAGIFKSVVAIILILGANWIAKRAGEDRLF